MGLRIDPDKLYAIVNIIAAENHLLLNHDMINAICKGYEAGYTQACDDTLKIMGEKGLLPQNEDK